MRIFVIVTVCAALGLCVFGVTERRGALLVRLDSRVAVMALIWGAVFLAASGAGYGIGKWILAGDLGRREIFWVNVVSGLILGALGIRNFAMAVRRTSFLERRMENVDMRHDTFLCLRSCFMGLLAGVVCGLLEVSFPGFIIAIFCTDLAATAGGYAFGRANGALLGSSLWAVSGALLCALGIILQLA